MIFIHPSHWPVPIPIASTPSLQRRCSSAPAPALPPLKLRRLSFGRCLHPLHSSLFPCRPRSLSSGNASWAWWIQQRRQPGTTPVAGDDDDDDGGAVPPWSALSKSLPLLLLLLAIDLTCRRGKKNSDSRVPVTLQLIWYFSSLLISR